MRALSAKAVLAKLKDLKDSIKRARADATLTIRALKNPFQRKLAMNQRDHTFDNPNMYDDEGMEYEDGGSAPVDTPPQDTFDDEEGEMPEGFVEDEIAGDDDEFPFGDNGEGEEVFDGEEDTPATPEEAVTMAIDDLQEIVEDLQSVDEDTEMAEESIRVGKRIGRKFEAKLETLALQAEAVLSDAKASVIYGRKLVSTIRSRGKKPSNGKAKFTHLKAGKLTVDGKAVLTGPAITGSEAIEEVGKMATGMNRLKDALLGKKKKATAIPPTGAYDSGDKIPTAGESWKNELSTDSTREGEYITDKRADDRLRGEPGDESPGSVQGDADAIVESLIGKESSMKLIRNKIPGKTAYVVSVNKIPRYTLSYEDAAGRKGEPGFNQSKATYKTFTSKAYADELWIKLQKRGLKKVKAEAGGSFIKLSRKTARTPQQAPHAPLSDPPQQGEYTAGPSGHKGEDTEGETLGERAYYSDMYGDSGYARDLTSEQEKKLKAEAAVKMAREHAARGLIEFNAKSITDKAKEVLKFSEQTFTETEKLINSLAVLNANALSDEVPADSGVAGNPLEGVGKPQAEADVENLNSEVASDANIQDAPAGNEHLSSVQTIQTSTGKQLVNVVDPDGGQIIQAELAATAVGEPAAVATPEQVVLNPDGSAPINGQGIAQVVSVDPTNVNAPIAGPMAVAPAGFIPQMSVNAGHPVAAYAGQGIIPDFTSSFSTTEKALIAKGLDPNNFNPTKQVGVRRIAYKQ